MKLSILVPFRDADGTRTRAKEWIVRRWAHHYPDAEIIEASDDGVDPFNKSMAVNKAAAQATGDIFAVLDADTWIDTQFMDRALVMVQQGTAWVIPARRSMRLRQDISEQIMALDPTGPLFRIDRLHAEQVGPVVGFLWVVRREGFEAVGGMDERIRGWGGEDTMFTWAMDRVAGKHRKLNGTVISLWHARPRQKTRRGHERIWVGQDRSTEQDKEALAQQYTNAKTRDAMLRVLGRPVPAPTEPSPTPPWRRPR